MSGRLSAFEEQAADGNPWRRKQPANSSAAAPDRLSGPIAGSAVAVVAATPDAMPKSPLPKVEAGHLTAQHPTRVQEAGQQQQSKPAAEMPGNDSGTIAAGWGSARRISATADLELDGAASMSGAVSSSTAAPQVPEQVAAEALPVARHPAAAAAKAGIQQQPAAVLTSTSMQLALQLRDYCKLIRSVLRFEVAGPSLLPCTPASTALDIRRSPKFSRISLAGCCRLRHMCSRACARCSSCSCCTSSPPSRARGWPS